MADPKRFLDVVSKARSLAKSANDTLEELEKLQAEWNAQDFTNNTDTPELTDPVYGNHEHEHLTKAEVAAFIYDTANAIRGLWTAGHATNVTNLF